VPKLDLVQQVRRVAYDGLNRRVIRHNYGSGFFTETRHFYYSDNWQVLEERVDDATYTPDRQFVWGLRYIDDLILRDRSFGDTLDERLYALQDANWNVVGFCNDIGAMQQRIAYTPYGLPIWLNTAFAPGSDDFAWETLYCGYRWDGRNDGSYGLYQVRFRFYHTEMGIWITRDPIAFSLQPYGYGSTLLLSSQDYTGIATFAAAKGQFLPYPAQGTPDMERIIKHLKIPHQDRPEDSLGKPFVIPAIIVCDSDSKGEPVEPQDIIVMFRKVVWEEATALKTSAALRILYHDTRSPDRTGTLFLHSGLVAFQAHLSFVSLDVSWKCARECASPLKLNRHYEGRIPLHVIDSGSLNAASFYTPTDVKRAIQSDDNPTIPAEFRSLTSSSMVTDH
jgi:hypothetical protein